MKIVLVLLVSSVVLVGLTRGMKKPEPAVPEVTKYSGECTGKNCEDKKPKCDGKDCKESKNWPWSGKNWPWEKPSNPSAKLEMKLKYLIFKVQKLSQQIDNIPIDLYKFKQIYNKDNKGPNSEKENWSGK